MPNWATNNIRILVRDDRAESLKAALAGPGGWWLESELRGTWGHVSPPTVSAHDLIALGRSHPDWRERLAALGRPDWLPMTPGDLAEFVAHAGDLSNHPYGTPAIISLPRFLPMSDLAQHRAFASDPMQWRLGAIGCKWMPHFSRMTRDGQFWSEVLLPEGRLLEAMADTPWAWPTKPLDVIRPALDAHGAEAIWFASEEANTVAEAFVLQDGEIRRWSWEGDSFPTWVPDEENEPDITAFDRMACEEQLQLDGVREEFLFSLGSEA